MNTAFSPWDAKSVRRSKKGCKCNGAAQSITMIKLCCKLLITYLPIYDKNSSVTGICKISKEVKKKGCKCNGVAQSITKALQMIKFLDILSPCLFKGQIISKGFFGIFNFLQKTNGNKSSWGIIVLVEFVHFLEETSA